jgi:hypothetical protein
MNKLFAGSMSAVALTAAISGAIPLEPAFAQWNEAPIPAAYMPGSFYAPMHGSDDKGAAIRANMLAAPRLRDEKAQ